MNKGFSPTKEEIESTVNELKEKTEKDESNIRAQYLNQPIPYNYTSGHSKIDDLVDANGNWYLEFRYHNFGNNTLFLLPDFCVDDKEKDKNDQVVGLLDGDFEESSILDQFIKEHPNTPFIIQEYCFDKCIETLKERLDKLIDLTNEFPYTKFQIEVTEFDMFRKAALNLSDLYSRDKGIYYAAAHEGWRKYVNIDIDKRD